MIDIKKYVLWLGLVACVAAGANADVVYNEDFSSYGSDIILSDGDSLGGGLLQWKRNTTAAWAVTNTVVSASDQLKTVLHPVSKGNSVYSYIAESTDIAALSEGQRVTRAVNLSMQRVPLTTSSTAASLAVGLVKSGSVPAEGNWGVALGFTVQFGYVDGATQFMIRRRGVDGATDSWNGSMWTDDFTTGLLAYSLDKDYSIVSVQTDTDLTLKIYDGETLLESATTGFVDMFDVPDGLTWMAGDFNSQNAALPYEFTLNSLTSTAVPEPATISMLIVGFFVVMLRVKMRA